MAATPPFHLHLGCGAVAPDGWINVDYALGARLRKIPGFRAVSRTLGLFAVDWSPRIVVHDLRTRFPWPDASVDAVYTSHTLEHFTREAGGRFIAEIHRVLKPAGRVRIVVPDLA